MPLGSLSRVLSTGGEKTKRTNLTLGRKYEQEGGFKSGPKTKSRACRNGINGANGAR